MTEDTPAETTAPIVVRPAVVEDAGAITEAHVRAWQAAYRGIMPDEYLDDLSTDIAGRRALRQAQIAAPADPGVRNFAVERDGKVIGWLSSGPSRDDDATSRTAEIWAVYVHPDHWGAGAGGALVKAAIGQLSADGYTEVTLWVFEENRLARGFYERYGWRTDGAAEIFERGGSQAIEIRYRRPLP